ncbi:MAG: carbohydrate binding domain-containing protein [Caldilineaceae bacterium]|nr:carbohydrate binding domain-containing protein [Caldilineaceae bacterium]
MEITQNSDVTLAFLLVEERNGTDPISIESPNVTLSMGGAGFKESTNKAQEIGEGWYKITLTKAETSTLGPLIVRASGTGSMEWRDIHYVVAPVDNSNNGNGGNNGGVVVNPEGPEITLGDNVLKNGDFKADKANWTLYSADAGGAKWEVKDGVATLQFPSESDNMQFYQADVVLRKGKARLSFEARGNAGHTLEIFFHQHKKPYLSLGLADGVRLTKDWEGYTIDFEVPKNETDGRLRFWFVGHANAGDTFYLRNIRLNPVVKK